MAAMSITLLCWLLLQHSSLLHAELFSALVDLPKMFQAQKQYVHQLQQYIQQEENKLRALRELIQPMQEDPLLPIVEQLGESLFHNPMRAFYFIKRHSVDVDRSMKKLVYAATEEAQEKFKSNIKLVEAFLPQEEDLRGVMDAIIRLQDVYKISPRQFVTGEFLSSPPITKLKAEDIFEIGKRAFDTGLLSLSRQWFELALDEIHSDVTKRRSANAKKIDEDKTLLVKAQVLDYLSYICHQMSSYQTAVALTNEWLRIEPNNSRALNNLRYFSTKAWESRRQIKPVLFGEKVGALDPIVKVVNADKYHTRIREFVDYKSLCRGEETHEPDSRDPCQEALHCRYHRPHPYFLLGPVKEEVVLWSPYIVLWHQIIHPHEIKHIKEMAAPELQRATVMNSLTGNLETAAYRVSKSAWLKDNSSSIVTRLNARISAMTQLSIETAEPLQVVNYGVGGHYEPHYDFSRRSDADPFEEGIGNRIATLLFYLSDLDKGGATVFTELGVKLWPQQGSAAFWWNLFDSGEGNLKTRHAACPVLAGSKWVMNKWFHERGQEFHRPCRTETIYF